MVEPPKKNPKGPLPYDQTFKFEPKTIVVAVLSMTLEDDGIGYGLAHTEEIGPENAGSTISRTQLQSVIESASREHFLPETKSLAKTPWDIKVRNQCYLVLVLDRRIPNWGFYDNAVESKGGSDAYDFNPYWWDARNLQLKETPVPKAELPKVVVFSIGRRGRKQSHQVDYRVKFVDPNGAGEMPTIFDPDVPNDGDPFP